MIHDRLRTRRFFLKGTAAATAAVASSRGSFPGAQAATKVLRIVTGGGSYEAALKGAMFDPYLAANPDARIVLDTPDDPARLKAMVQAGNVTADLWITGSYFGLDSDAEWLEPINYDTLDASGLLPGSAMKYRVGNDIEDTLVAYRKDHFSGEPPKNFNDFFDAARFPGKRGVWKSVSGGIFEAALLADGVAYKDLYPIDVERALKKLSTIRDKIVWWDSGAQAQQLLTSGEASLVMTWGSRILPIASMAPVAVAWGQWIGDGGWWMIPKGAANKDEAYRALKFFLSQGPQAALTKFLPYGPTNKAASENPDPRYKGNLSTDHLDTLVVLKYDWWIQNQARIDERFQQWLLE